MSSSSQAIGDRRANDVCTIDYGHRSQRRSAYNSYESRYFGLSDRSLNYTSPKPFSVNCGELRLEDANMRVHMTGRIQFQRLSKFLVLSDSHGNTQLVVLDERPSLLKKVLDIPPNSHVEINGTVQARPRNTVNPKMDTGEIEVIIDEVLDVFAPKRKLDKDSDEETFTKGPKKPCTSIAMTSLEASKCFTNAAKKKYQRRTFKCTDLSKDLEGMEVSVSGWIKEKRKEGRFGTLYDGYGAAQIIIDRNNTSVVQTLMEVQVCKTLVNVEGVIMLRPLRQVNPKEPSGHIEILVTSMEIIDPNEPDSEEPDDNILEEVHNPGGTENGLSSVSPGNVNSYCTRTHTCGELQWADVGKEVVLCGWLDSQRLNRFVLLRDGHGTTQLIVPLELMSSIGRILSQTNNESVIKVTGTVCGRPPNLVDKGISTGEIEVRVKELEVLSLATIDLPFVIRDDKDSKRPKKSLRMKYRYLDLRCKDMQYSLRLRSKVLMKMREFLINQRGFVEVETPTLFRPTPGGVQEYVVPTRIEDKFYSLVQSPQQFKQLLMIGCMDRYFQVARCYRDEGAQPDRQPEFTQMDIELSFTDREHIMRLIEDLLKDSFPEHLPIQTPFPVLRYHEAMHWYGSDKPDLSFDKKLIDISELIEDTDLLPENLQDIKHFTAKVLVFDSSCSDTKLIDSIYDCEGVQKLRGDNKAKMFTVRCSTEWKEDVEKALPFLDANKLKNAIEFPLPCTIVVGIGQETEILPLMGKLRCDMFKKPTSSFHFTWIVDFPLFIKGEDHRLESAHHPFTQPNQQDIHLLDTDPLKVRGLHYDLVLNGCEVGRGSVRIHDPLMQIKVLKDILKIPLDSLEHLLEALASGAPPHGGIALGIDRLLSIMVGADTIRDVIAFPKGVDGKDPMSGAPCSISDEEKRLYHLIRRSRK